MKIRVAARTGRINGGVVLGLDKDQIHRRQRMLAKEGKGFRVTSEFVTFKQDEEVTVFDGAVDMKSGDWVDADKAAKAERENEKREAAAAEARAKAEQPADETEE